MSNTPSINNTTDSDSFDEKYNSELSTNVSAINPIAFHGNDNDPQLQNNNEILASIPSLKRSLEILKRTVTGQSQVSVKSQYSIKDIYGDLSSEQIEKERALIRDDLLKEIQHNINNFEPDIEPFDLPETALPIEKNGEDLGVIDPELITWQGYNDPQDPRNWSVSKKVYLTGFVSLYALISPMSSSILSPAVSEISQDFHITNSTISAMLVSIQILAWAIGPLIISPLSEFDFIGRKPVLDMSIWLSFFFNLGCGLTRSTAQMLVLRFVGGLFGSAPLNVGAAVIADLFDAKSRNVALAGFVLAPLLGPIISPVIAGFIVDHTHWRWVFYVISIFNGVVAIMGTLFFKETSSAKLLKLKANQLRASTKNPNLHTIYEITDQPFNQRMLTTMTRPIKLLFTNIMVIGLGSFLAFVYGFMYLMIVTFPMVFGTTYGYKKSIVGLLYLPMGVGFIIGVFFWTWMIGKTYNQLTESNNGIPKPEFRLPCLFIVGIIIPIGLIWYGWSSQKQLHWIMPSIGSGIFAFGFVCAFQCCQSYLIDMNPRFAASSVAAAALFRSLFGFGFPLFAKQMYDKLGYGWGNSLSALLAFLLGVPFPIYCYYHGERIRESFNRRFEQEQAVHDKAALQQLHP